MRTRLSVESLEARDVPAQLGGYDAEWLRSEGFDPDNYATTNIAWDGDEHPDLVVVGGPGAGPRVAVYDGRPGPTDGLAESPRPVEPTKLADFMAAGYDPAAYRGGLRALTVWSRDAHDFAAAGQVLVLAPASDGMGSVVTRVPAGDAAGGGAAGTLFGGDFRGYYDLTASDLDLDGADELVALARTGGAPRLVVADLDGVVTHSFFVGPEGERQVGGREYHLLPAGTGVQTGPGEGLGVVVTTPDGAPRFFRLDGSLVEPAN